MFVRQFFNTTNNCDLRRGGSHLVIFEGRNELDVSVQNMAMKVGTQTFGMRHISEL